MKRRLLSILIFIAYSTILIKVMVFKDVPTITTDHVTLSFGGTNGGHPANFVPFATIWPYLIGEKGFTIAFLNVAGNIAFLVPIGFLAAFVYRRSITGKKSLILAFVYGLAIELLQSVLHVGIFDIDDVILNVLGVMIGYWVFLLFATWVSGRKYINIFIAIMLVITAVAGAFYALYPHEPPVMNLGASEGNQFESGNNEQKGIFPKSDDLCEGTGGTGQIINQENHAITIKRKDGVVKTINLTDRTDMRNSAGPVSASDLKTGDSVTVVVDEGETASTVLVCNP